ncbi:hypothetical protein N7517_004059 [Penicillium concentricum]|uniref:Uncharacterized protein n=1 Tax=Penicillium concentricum TaxID=293559 RepID=A0A9W9V7S5_9EURO|nr:uncharacterized protein N7517_004059 [Penicillium concentricum]KAJ5372053.1 hypothetical protein N7517_004059 [Penicillium concentricum]
MQLTILSEKLDSLTMDDFIHEFRVIHATETRTMAKTLGIITKYIQGVRLPNKDPLLHLPIPEADPFVHSFAQLSWPSVTVLQGALSTEGYRKSAGSHVFAIPLKVYVTEKLHPGTEEEIQSPDSIRVVVGLSPLSTSSFPQKWSEHAAFCRSICDRYQRHQIIPLDAPKIEQIFGHTQFTPNAVVTSGGYEDFVFGTRTEAQAFFDQHGSAIRDSYDRFVDPKSSFCYAFDNVLQYSPSDRGFIETVVGFFIGIALRLKVLFNC